MNNRTSRFAWTTALALGTVIGALIGLPRTQAQAPPAGAATEALAARLQRLESRVDALEGQVKALKSHTATGYVPEPGRTPQNGLGPGNRFGGPGNPLWPNWQIVPVAK